jgi:hypothetical protein
MTEARNNTTTSLEIAMQARSIADKAIAKIEGHEDLCADRWAEARKELLSLRDSIGNMSKGVWGIVIAIAGWALVTLFNTLQRGLH